MSTVKIVKGFPLQLNIGVTDDDTPIDINDGNWTVTAELHYQTRHGTKPFDISPDVNGLGVQISLTDTQTSQLNHLGTGYILSIRAYKNDQTVFLKTDVPVSVTDDL